MFRTIGTLAAVLFFLVGCGESKKGTQIKFKFASRPLTHKSNRGYPPPTTDAGFDCYAINVMAADIPPEFDTTVADPFSTIQTGGTCSYPGITSSVVAAQTSATSFTMKIPVGPKRVIQVLGIQAPGGCGSELSGHFNSNSLEDTVYSGIYEIGRAVVDVQGPQTIAISSSYDAGAPREVRCHCRLSRFQSGTFAAGNGASTSPFHICTGTQLNHAASALGSTYVVDQSLDLSNISSTMIGQSGTPFTGVFDGQGYALKNLMLISATQLVGFFGATSIATLKNIWLTNASVTATASTSAGVLAGVLTSSHVSNCRTEGTISGSQSVGGFVGRTVGGSSASITRSSADVVVSASSAVAGGFVGTLDGVAVTHSFATGNVIELGTNTAGAGGFVGALSPNTSASIDTSFATGTVTGKTHSGGFIGLFSNGTVSNCYATGSVSATFGGAAGGVVGSITSGGSPSMSGCYASSESVVSTSADLGGCVGKLQGSTPQNCYTNSLVDRTGAGYSGTPLTTAAMKLKASYSVGFDFGSTWDIQERITFPFLR